MISVAASPQHRGAMVALTKLNFGYRCGATVFCANQMLQAGGELIHLSGVTNTLLQCGVGSMYGPADITGTGNTSATPNLWFALLALLTHGSLATAPTIDVVVRCWMSPGFVLTVPTNQYAYTVTSKQELPR